MTPGFVVIGHVVKDLLPNGWRLGGTATFAAVQALRLGLRPGIVTRAGDDVDLASALPGVELAIGPSPATTSFENVYEDGLRRQRVPARAEPIVADDVPAGWRAAPIVLLGPVCRELSADIAGVFSPALLGVSAQGWLRTLDPNGNVRRRAWLGAPFWRRARAVFVSDEDLGARRDELDAWTRDTPVTVLTRYRKGARVHSNGRWRDIAAFPAREVDPTGAGDVFAAAYLVRYHETHDNADAARFASAAAACAVEGTGIDAIADRVAIEARLAAHPEITLR